MVTKNEVNFDDLDSIIGAPNDKPSDDDFSLDMTDIERGVSITWLAYAFHMDKNTVKRRIAPLEPIGKKLGHPVYAIRQAAAYLIQPKVDIADWIKKLRPNDLPPLLQETFWAAALKRQKWEENAGDLWRTDSILDVFGELAMSIKSQVQLWVENVDRNHNISPEIRKAITDQSDNLLAEIHKILIEAPSKKRTENQLSELTDMSPEVQIEEGDV